MPIKIDKLIRSRRRSISLEITREAQLVVRMPRYANVREVKQFILEKRVWIEKKIKEIAQRANKNTPKRFIPGEKFYYLGEKYPLKNIKGQSTKLKFNNGFYLEEGNTPVAKNIFTKWYKRQAKLNISKRVSWYSTLYKLRPNKIKITSASGRWGSCTTQGNLNFTWKLILLPLKILDYVVVHELAHLKQPNHSKIFWVEVEKMLPDYRERRKWLKKNGEEYTL